MAFYGSDFKYNSFWASQLGLQIYDFASSNQGNASDFVAHGDIVSDYVAGRDDMLYYGQENKDSLTPHLVFGINTDRLDRDEFLTRYEISKIAEWLTADGKWHWLTVKQDDMIEYRYKVVLGDLKLLHNGMQPYAFEADFVADSPYAYMYPSTYTWRRGRNIFNNKSTNKGYFYPTMTIHLSSGGGDFSIINNSDNGREFSFTGLPQSVTEIHIDNKNQIITEAGTGLNLYDYFNYKFFRAVKGKNEIIVTGRGYVDVFCEFPVNIGV